MGVFSSLSQKPTAEIMTRSLFFIAGKLFRSKIKKRVPNAVRLCLLTGFKCYEGSSDNLVCRTLAASIEMEIVRQDSNCCRAPIMNRSPSSLGSGPCHQSE
jgi:hypothetical protein